MDRVLKRFGAAGALTLAAALAFAGDVAQSPPRVPPDEINSPDLLVGSLLCIGLVLVLVAARVLGRVSGRIVAGGICGVIMFFMLWLIFGLPGVGVVAGVFVFAGVQFDDTGRNWTRYAGGSRSAGVSASEVVARGAIYLRIAAVLGIGSIFLGGRGGSSGGGGFSGGGGASGSW